MTVSKEGRNLISAFEGATFKPYRCPAGYWTIGVGHRMSAQELWRWADKELTPHQVDVLLSDDLYKVESAVENRVKVAIDQYQFDALASLAFNIGVGAFGDSTLVKKLNAGQPCVDEFHKWVHITENGKKIKLNGLIERRTCEAQVFQFPLLSPEEKLSVLRFYHG